MQKLFHPFARNNNYNYNNAKGRSTVPAKSECPKLKFLCNGTCIDWSLYCNGKIDCDDEQDEKYCGGNEKIQKRNRDRKSEYLSKIKLGN